MSHDKIAELLVALEMPFKFFVLFLVFMYVIWFWNVGPYEGFMKTMQTIQLVVEKVAIAIYTSIAWLVVGIVRIFSVVFATVRDFFISRI